MTNHNAYDIMVDQYTKSHTKPDKQYSMLPTVLSLCAGGKYIVDVGCGDGFFTEPLTQLAERVAGIDISVEQLKKARKKQVKRAVFRHADMKNFNYAEADVVNAPYVINYSKSQEEVETFFARVYKGLAQGGRLVAIVDMPNSTIHDMQKFGSIKCLKSLHDGEEITIQLFHGNEKLVTLKSFYYTKETLGKLLYSVGFKQVTWHKPIVSEEGKTHYGEAFWKEYLKRCDVAYFTAVK